MINIITVGLNHKTAPVELRERLAFAKGRLQQAYSLLRNFSSLQEGLLLSTCNRVEIYGVVDNIEQGICELKEFLKTYHRVNLEDFARNLYIYPVRNFVKQSGEIGISNGVYLSRDSVDHLFNVASGLDSMVLGETQILGQLKQAYFNAHQFNAVGKILDALLQRAFCTAKQVHNSTNIAKGVVSVSSITVELAQEIMGELPQKKVMIIGAGKISELTAKNLIARGTSAFLVSNRTYQKAVELAHRFGARAIRFDEIFNFMVEADIVISSTCAPHFILKKEDILPLMQQRKKRPLFFIDLAVPRDIDPEIAKIAGVYLYDIDDLQRIAQRNIQLRQKEIDSCRQIIQSNVDKFMDWFERQKKEEIPFSNVLAGSEESLLTCG